MRDGLWIPLALMLFVCALLFVGSQADKKAAARELEIKTLEAQVEGLHKMIAAGVVIPVYDGIPVKRPRAMKPKE